MKKGWLAVCRAGVAMYVMLGAAACSLLEPEEAPPVVAVQPADEATAEAAQPSATDDGAVPAAEQPQPEVEKKRGVEPTLSKFSQEIAAKVYNELEKEGAVRMSDTVAVVAAVPLSDLKRETEFGRLLAEYLMTDLADQGLRVTELRLGKEITILPQSGEFIMTRNIGELQDQEPQPDFVMLSTFGNTRNTLVVQGRLVSRNTGVVATSWRFSMPMSRELIGLFQDVSEKPVTIAVKGID